MIQAYLQCASVGGGRGGKGGAETESDALLRGFAGIELTGRRGDGQAKPRLAVPSSPPRPLDISPLAGTSMVLLPDFLPAGAR